MENVFQNYISTDPNRMELHQNAHSMRNGTASFICLITDCTLANPLAGSFDATKNAIEKMPDKELKILLEKNAFKNFTESEKKKILGDRYVGRQ